MASSIAEVWTLALGLLKQDQEIIDPSDTSTKAGRLCNRFWATARDQVLEAAAWSCATRRKTLSASGDTVAFEHERRSRFTLPADCVRIVAVTLDGEADGDPIYHEREGRQIICDVDAPLKLRYVSRDVPTTEWDASLVFAAAAELAVNLAMPLTEKNSERERMLVIARDAIGKAESNDAVNAEPPQKLESSWVTSRN